MVSLKEFFKKVDFEKNQMTKSKQNGPNVRPGSKLFDTDVFFFKKVNFEKKRSADVKHLAGREFKILQSFTKHSRNFSKNNFPK